VMAMAAQSNNVTINWVLSAKFIFVSLSSDHLYFIYSRNPDKQLCKF
jgi:hypothetical protein